MSPESHPCLVWLQRPGTPASLLSAVGSHFPNTDSVEMSEGQSRPRVQGFSLGTMMRAAHKEGQH
jgi:hypothetical protein